jgi:hypothetical protein
MKKKTQPDEKNDSNRKDVSGSWSQELNNLSLSVPGFSGSSAPDFSSFEPYLSSYEPHLVCAPAPNVPYFDLSIYREFKVKSMLKAHSKDMYRLLEGVRFDGKYYRVKCVYCGGWEYCWDLAVKVEYFGQIQGMAVYPKRRISQKEKRIVYRSMILVNPYQLWDGSLVNRFWNLQERMEFLIARILFHECIHVMISLGKTLPSGYGNNDIFSEFKKILEVSNSESLCSELQDVQFRICNLILFGASDSEKEQKLFERAQEIYEFLLNEKYSHQKTGSVFRSPFNNKKIARKYAWIAGVKAGGHTQVSKRTWEVEVRRLSIALRKLYDGLDKNLTDC